MYAAVRSVVLYFCLALITWRAEVHIGDVMIRPTRQEYP